MAEVQELTDEQIVDKLIQFINDNNLQFEGDGSGANSDCCVLSGYALFISEDDPSDSNIREAVKKARTMFDGLAELSRVYEYAYNSDYIAPWENGEYEGTYKY